MNAPIFVAQEKGFFKQVGLDAEVEVYATGRIALEELYAGKGDVAMVAQTPLAESALKAGMPAIVSTVAESDQMHKIAARVDRGIARPQDLEGKRIGVASGTSAEFFLDIFLTTSGVDPSTVERVPLKPDTQVDALVAGEVDALSAFAPYFGQAMAELGPNGVLFEAPGLYTLLWNVVTTREKGAERQTELIRLLRAVDLARAYINEHPDEARAITSKWSGAPEDEIKGAWLGMRWTNQLDQSLILSLEDEARWMIADSQSGTPTPDFLDYLDTGPLRKVEPRQVTVIEAD